MCFHLQIDLADAKGVRMRVGDVVRDEFIGVGTVLGTIPCLGGGNNVAVRFHENDLERTATTKDQMEQTTGRSASHLTITSVADTGAPLADAHPPLPDSHLADMPVEDDPPGLASQAHATPPLHPRVVAEAAIDRSLGVSASQSASELPGSRQSLRPATEGYWAEGTGAAPALLDLAAAEKVLSLSNGIFCRTAAFVSQSSEIVLDNPAFAPPLKLSVLPSTIGPHAGNGLFIGDLFIGKKRLLGFFQEGSQCLTREQFFRKYPHGKATHVALIGGQYFDGSRSVWGKMNRAPYGTGTANNVRLHKNGSLRTSRPVYPFSELFLSYGSSYRIVPLPSCH